MHAFLACIVLATSSSVSPVAKVVELLVDLKTKLTEESTAGGELYAEFVQQSLSEEVTTNATISAKESEISEGESFIEEQTELQNKLSTEIEELAGTIAAKESDLQNATEIRKAEEKQFRKDDEERAHAIRQVELAIDTMSKEASFLQQGNLPSQVNLLPVVQQKLLLLQAQGVSSNNVLDLLRNIEDETSTDRDTGVQNEQEAKNSFELLKSALEEDIRIGKEAKNEKQQDRSKSEQDTSSMQSTVNSAKSVVSEAYKYRTVVLAERQQRTLEHQARMQLLTDELTALQEAEQVLTSERAMQVFNAPPDNLPPQVSVAATLLQLRLTTRRVRGKASLLPVSLVEVAQSTHHKDPFTKVKTMVKDMITNLNKEQAEATDHHEYCVKEMGKTEKSIKDRTKEFEKLQGRFEARQAQVTQLGEDITEIKGEIYETNEAKSAAVLQRSEAEQAAKIAIANNGDAAKLVHSAINILADIFDKPKGESALQTTRKETPGQKPDATGWAIIGILEVAEADYTKLHDEAVQQEAMAVRQHAALMTEFETQVAVLYKDSENQERLKLQVEGDMETDKQDMDAVGRELEAVKKYYEDLKPECTVKAPTHEERAKRREVQIENLNNALDTLNGDAMP